MGGTTSFWVTVAVMVVGAASTGLGALGGAVHGWGPAIGGAISGASLVLVLPAMVSSAARVVRGRPGWLRFVAAWTAALAASVAAAAAVGTPEVAYIGIAVLLVAALAFWIVYRLWPAPLPRSLDPDRFGAVLEEGERPLAAVEVRVSGTLPLRLVLAYGAVGVGVVLGFGVLSFGPVILVVLPFAVVTIPGLCLLTAIGNRRAERGARRGPRRSVAQGYPRSNGALGMWPLVLTDRRLIVVRTGRGGQMDLLWSFPWSELTGAAAAGRSLRGWDPTIRLQFNDGSSIRLTAPDARGAAGNPAERSVA